MRHLSLAALAGAAWTIAACHDTLPPPIGPDTAIAAHFDSLSAQANAGSQANRVAALNLALRTFADGGIPGTLILATGSGAHDSATYNTVTYGQAKVIAKSTSDSVEDSLIVFVGWRGANADTMVVIRSGHTQLAPQVQGELATLGLTNHLVTSDTTDTLTSAAFVTGNTVTLADSGAIEGDFGIFGAQCKFVTVNSVGNDAGATHCNRELYQWTYGVRFSPSTRLGLPTPAFSPGIVIQP